MTTQITGLGFELTDPIVAHVRSRLAAALTLASDQLRRAVVRLDDQNGPRGGEDKSCRVIVWLRPRTPVVVEAVDRDLYTAVDRAARKLREAVRRRLTRRRSGRQVQGHASSSPD